MMNLWNDSSQWLRHKIKSKTGMQSSHSSRSSNVEAFSRLPMKKIQRLKGLVCMPSRGLSAWLMTMTATHRMTKYMDRIWNQVLNLTVVAMTLTMSLKVQSLRWEWRLAIGVWRQCRGRISRIWDWSKLICSLTRELCWLIREGKRGFRALLICSGGK
jgi:hypothetical protein